MITFAAARTRAVTAYRMDGSNKGGAMNRQRRGSRWGTVTFVALAAVAMGVAVACDDDNTDNEQPTAESTQGAATATGETPAEGGGEPQAEPTPAEAALTDDALQMDAIEGIDQPTQMIFLAENDLLVGEKTGDIVRVTDGAVVGPVAELAANFHDERGVLGLTRHPQFEQNNYVYVYWTWNRPSGTAPCPFHVPYTST